MTNSSYPTDHLVMFSLFKLFSWLVTNLVIFSNLSGFLNEISSSESETFSSSDYFCSVISRHNDIQLLIILYSYNNINWSLHLLNYTASKGLVNVTYMIRLSSEIKLWSIGWRISVQFGGKNIILKFGEVLTSSTDRCDDQLFTNTLWKMFLTIL